MTEYVKFWKEMFEVKSVSIGFRLYYLVERSVSLGKLESMGQ